jgi:hypothetical protein
MQKHPREQDVRCTSLFFLLAYQVACFLSQPLAAAGQTVNASTGTVEGSVTDSTSAVLADVAITISSDALMRPRRTLTDAQGFYRFAALPPGEYTVVVALQGFTAARREAFRVGAGFTATIDIVMTPSTVVERVIVERQSPVVDRQSVAIATTFGADQLANLPGARNMVAILAATPAVYLTRFDVGGNSTALGSDNGAFGISGSNRPMVEGIDTTGVQGTGFTFDYGSFDEVLVSTGAHAAEWPKPGVQMQFIAKSGGDQYHGSLYADYESRHWQGSNVDEGQIARGLQHGGGLSPRDTNRLWTYHDVNADEGGFIKKNTAWWYASFRDQEVAARYINFPVKPHRTRVTNYTGKTTYQATPRHKLLAYGQAGRSHQPNRLDPSGLTDLSPMSAINESEDSTIDQLGWGWVLKGEWNAIIDDRLFVEVRAGQFGADLQQRPRGAAPRFEDVSTSSVRGGNRDSLGHLRREQIVGSLSHFKNGRFGNHHFKGGAEIYRTMQAEIWKRGYPGDVLHVLSNGNPREVFLLQTPSRSEAGFWAYAGYANDSWRVSDRTTLNLGLRFDRFRIFLPAQQHPVGRFNQTAQTFAAIDNVIDWNVLAPRIGITADPAGDGRAIVKFSYGQYWVNPGVATGFNASPNPSLWWQRRPWSDLDGSGVWEPGEEGGFGANRGGAAIESLDPELELPFVREITGRLERELHGHVAVRAGLVWRGQRQPFLRQNANQPFEAFGVPVLIPDPGPDGNRGTEDDGLGIEGRDLLPEALDLQPSNVLRNVPNSDSHYWTVDLTASKRFNGRWSLVAGFAHTWSRDQDNRYFGQSIRQNMFPLTPNDLINAGPKGRHQFRIWSAKIHGTYRAPWDLRITPFLRHQSGQPFGRTFSTSLNFGNNIRVLAEPVGTRRMDNVTILDVRVEKGFRLPGDRRLSGFLDVFNVLNANPEQNISWSSGSFLQPLNIVAPRIARIGTKLEW